MITAKDLKWLQLCMLAGPVFSTCSRRQFFSVVIDREGRTAGTGWNGSPPGTMHCVDGGCPRGVSDVAHGSDYSSGSGLCVANHAEANALLYSDRSSRLGGTLYVNGPPCWGCGILIASCGIRRLVHLEDPSYADWPRVCELLEQSGVTVLGLDADQL